MYDDDTLSLKNLIPKVLQTAYVRKLIIVKIVKYLKTIYNNNTITRSSCIVELNFQIY